MGKRSATRRSSLFFSKFMFAPGTSMLFQFLSVSRTPRLQYRGECSYSRVFPIWRGTAPGSGSTLLATMEVLLRRGIRRLFPAAADLFQPLCDALLQPAIGWLVKSCAYKGFGKALHVRQGVF